MRQKSTPLAGGRTRTSAAVLALFFGGLGWHKFYLGQSGFGVLYQLFCWTFVRSLVEFIEAIACLSTTDQPFNARYNQTFSAGTPFLSPQGGERNGGILTGA